MHHAAGAVVHHAAEALHHHGNGIEMVEVKDVEEGAMQARSRAARCLL